MRAKKTKSGGDELPVRSRGPKSNSLYCIMRNNVAVLWWLSAEEYGLFRVAPGLAPSNESMPRPCPQDGLICMLLPVHSDLPQVQRLLSFIHHA